MLKHKVHILIRLILSIMRRFNIVLSDKAGELIDRHKKHGEIKNLDETIEDLLSATKIFSLKDGWYWATGTEYRGPFQSEDAAWNDFVDNHPIEEEI